MVLNRHKTLAWRHATLALVCLAVVAGAALAWFKLPGTEAQSGYLPKDVPNTPAASPLASPPPETALKSNAVSLNLPDGSRVGPETSVRGTATAPDGTVYYRISDYRRGQIASGQVSVPSGPSQPFEFQPQFSRVYTKGDPAALDVYVLDSNGTEQTTRRSIKLQ